MDHDGTAKKPAPPPTPKEEPLEVPECCKWIINWIWKVREQVGAHVMLLGGVRNSGSGQLVPTRCKVHKECRPAKL